jgi:predicted DNA-binding transcriptional regulator YafY
MRPAMPRDNFEKHDRLIRLMRELALFQAQPRGLTTAQIAERMGVSQRQAQRDIAALESEFKVPFVKQSTRWTLIEGYFLPPVNFTIPEAMAMVVGARLMWRYADRANPFAQAAYEKLAAVLPAAMKEPVMEVADGLGDKPDDGVWTKVFAALTTAWAERRKVRIRYTKEDGSTSERVVWPLFLEPTPAAHTLYLIAHDEKRHGPRVFRVERISSVVVLEQRFSPPLGSSLRKMLGHAWGIWTSDHPVEVVLRFTPRVAARVIATTWHQSQEVLEQDDRSVELRLVIAELTEIRPWILGWGKECEVIAPAALRESIARELGEAIVKYDARGSLTPVRVLKTARGRSGPISRSIAG